MNDRARFFHVVVAAFAVTFATVASAQEQADGRTQAVEQAVAKNPTLRAAMLEVASAR